MNRCDHGHRLGCCHKCEDEHIEEAPIRASERARVAAWLRRAAQGLESRVDLSDALEPAAVLRIVATDIEELPDSPKEP